MGRSRHSRSRSIVVVVVVPVAVAVVVAVLHSLLEGRGVEFAGTHLLLGFGHSRIISRWPDLPAYAARKTAENNIEVRINCHILDLSFPYSHTPTCPL